MTASRVELHGIVGRFGSGPTFREALREIRAAGFTRIEANMPFPVEGIEELWPAKPTPIARFVLFGALIGGGGGYFLQWFAARDYPLNVGSRPLHSWPAFVPVTFELAVLTAAVVGVGALLWLCGLPRLDHPILSTAEIERATQDRFFICIRADDPRFDAPAVRRLFESLDAERVEEVPA
jgi:hypothetical protein